MPRNVIEELRAAKASGKRNVIEELRAAKLSNNQSAPVSAQPQVQQLPQPGAQQPQQQPSQPTNRRPPIRGMAFPSREQPQASSDPFTELGESINPVQAGFISAGRGLVKIGRALGLEKVSDIFAPEDETVKRGFEALEKASPISTTIGEALGESAPFVAAPLVLPALGVGAAPAGGAVATGALARFAATRGAQIAGTAGLGALEGVLIARGEGGTAGEQLQTGVLGGAAAGTLEVVLPVLGRIAGKVVRRVTGRAPKGALVSPTGTPTQELTEALDSAGLSFDDLAEGAVETLQKRPGAVPGQAAVSSEFESLGIPATRGDILGATEEGFSQQAKEARLFDSAASVDADQIRALRLEQSQAIKGNIEGLISESGVPDDIGKSIKDALSGRKTLLRNEKNALYREAAEKADNVGALPFPTQTLEQALPDQRTMRRLGRIQGGQSEAALDLMAEFGVDKSEAALKRIADKGIEVEPLSLQNFEEFRAAMNQIERADQTGASSVLIGPVKDALDGEADDLASTLLEAGITNENVLAPLREARKTVRQLKTEFSPQAITGRLIGAKKDGVTPVIEASQVFKDIVGTNKPIELIERTVKSLGKSGESGKQAIANLQAATIMDLIEHGFKAETRTVQGVKLFGPVAFNKRLKQIGQDKLEVIFSNSPETLRKLNRISKVAERITPPSGAVPKGSASVNLDALLGVLGSVPVAGKLANVVRGMGTLSKMGGDSAAIKRALDTTPDLISSTTAMEQAMPSMFAALGIAGTREKQKEAK